MKTTPPIGLRVATEDGTRGTVVRPDGLYMAIKPVAFVKWDDKPTAEFVDVTVLELVPNDVQERWIDRLLDAGVLSGPFASPADAEPCIAPDGNVRMRVGDGLMLVLPKDGGAHFELAGGSPVPDLLDSDGPDYNPEALLG